MSKYGYMLVFRQMVTFLKAPCSITAIQKLLPPSCHTNWQRPFKLFPLLGKIRLSPARNKHSSLLSGTLCIDLSRWYQVRASIAIDIDLEQIVKINFCFTQHFQFARSDKHYSLAWKTRAFFVSDWTCYFIETSAYVGPAWWSPLWEWV